MKTIKKLSFAVVTFVALSFSLSSCDAITEALSKEVEVEAAPIPFSVGGLTGAPLQKKVNSAGNQTYVWFDKDVDITTKIKEKLAELKLTENNLKMLELRGASINLLTSGIDARNLGDLRMFINDTFIGHAHVSPEANDPGQEDRTATRIYFHIHERDLSKYIALGKIKLRIESNMEKPNVKIDMNLVNKFFSKISLIK